MISRVLWWPVNLVQGLLITLWTAGWILAAMAVRWISRSNGPSLAMARRLWAPGVLAISGVTVLVEGLERPDLSRPCLFAMNHQSQLDIPVAFYSLPVNLRFMVKSELQRIPLLSHYISAMGMVFLDRRDRLRSLERMSEASELLRRGAHFLSFPEGSRSRDGELHRFKSGAFIPAIEAGADVVPVAVIGAGALLPRDTLRLRPGRVKVIVGEPVSTRGRDISERHRLAEEIQGQVGRLYEGGLGGASR